MNQSDLVLSFALKLEGLKAGTRYQKPTPKIRPTLTPEQRDLLVRLLRKHADELKSQ